MVFLWLSGYIGNARVKKKKKEIRKVLYTTSPQKSATSEMACFIFQALWIFTFTDEQQKNYASLFDPINPVTLAVSSLAHHQNNSNFIFINVQMVFPLED